MESRPVARIFRGEGGAYVKNQDQIFNVGMIRYASSEDTQGRVSNLLGLLNSNWDDL